MLGLGWTFFGGTKHLGIIEENEKKIHAENSFMWGKVSESMSLLETKNLGYVIGSFMLGLVCN